MITKICISTSSSPAPWNISVICLHRSQSVTREESGYYANFNRASSQTNRFVSRCSCRVNSLSNVIIIKKGPVPHICFHMCDKFMNHNVMLIFNNRYMEIYICCPTEDCSCKCHVLRMFCVFRGKSIKKQDPNQVSQPKVIDEPLYINVQVRSLSQWSWTQIGQNKMNLEVQYVAFHNNSQPHHNPSFLFAVPSRSAGQCGSNRQCICKCGLFKRKRILNSDDAWTLCWNTIFTSCALFLLTL